MPDLYGDLLRVSRLDPVEIAMMETVNHTQTSDLNRSDAPLSAEVLLAGGIVNESIVDGPGIRMAVFAQGCTHGCADCHNMHLWPEEGGTPYRVTDIVQMAAKNPLLDGITLSGGEPFQQADACAALATGAKALGLHVMAFTGYTWEELMAGKDTTPAWSLLLEQVDLLVEGRFEASLRDISLRFRGSSNQRAVDVQASLREGKLILADL